MRAVVCASRVVRLTDGVGSRLRRTWGSEMDDSLVY